MISLPDIERRLGIKFSNVDLHTEFDACRIVAEFDVQGLPCRFKRTCQEYSNARLDLNSAFDEFEKELRETLQKLGLFKEQKSEDKPILGWYCKRWHPNAQDYLPEVSLDKPSEGLFSNGIIPLVAK